MKGLEASLNGGGGLGCTPLALYIQLGIVSAVVKGVLLGPEVLEADVCRESFHGPFKVGLWQGLFNAELESIPEELIDPLW